MGPAFAVVENMAFPWSVQEGLIKRPFPMEGQWTKTKRAGFSGLLASHHPGTSWLTSDKLLNVVCSCFLICETGVSIYARGLLAV